MLKALQSLVWFLNRTWQYSETLPRLLLFRGPFVVETRARASCALAFQVLSLQT